MSSNGSSSPNPSNSRNFILILLLAAFGAPSAAYASFQTYFSQHLSQGIPILISYELALLIIGILKFVWQDFQLTRTFVNLIRMMISYPFYTKYYQNHLLEIFNDDIVLGLDGPTSTKIEQIFVEPTFLENPSYQDLSNPHKLLQISQSKKDTIWHYLVQNNLLILGAAGIGKSTLLKYLAITLADHRKSTESKVSYKIPLFLSLSKLSEEMKKKDVLSLEDAVESAISERWDTPRPGWVEHQLKKNCLILMDGLDEIADSSVRLNVLNRIDQYIDQHNKSRFIISSRPLISINYSLEKMTRLGILPFDRDQIFEFIDKWYEAITGNIADEKAKRLKDRLNESRSKHKFHDLARSPLLLGLIMNVHQKGTLPENRIDLYERIFEHYLVVRWRQGSFDNQELPAQESLSMEQKQNLLQTLAYKMMESGEREIWPDRAEEILEPILKDMKVLIGPEQFLKSATDTGIWILGQRPGRSSKFAHLSFQAYLAAVYARRNPEQLLKSHIDDNWWLETIILYCSQADPTPIIKASLREGESRLVENAENLALALYDEQEVQNMLINVKPVDIYQRFNQAIILAAEDQNIELRHRIANKQLAQRIQDLTDDEDWPIEERKLDTTYIRCTEYQLFLDLTKSERQPDHWKDTQFPKKQGYEPVLGIRLSDAIAFCYWLRSREPKAWDYRLPTTAESNNISVGEEDQGFWTKDGNKYQFVWGKGKSPALKSINPDILKSFLIKYSGLNQKDKDLMEPSVLNLANNISSIDQAFNESIAIYNEFIDFISSIFSRILKHKSELEARYKEVSKHVDVLNDQISNSAREKTKFQNELKRIENLRTQRDENKKRTVEAEKERVEIIDKQNSLFKEKDKLLKDIVNLQNEQMPQNQYPSHYSIQQQITSLVEKKEEKEQQIQNLELKANRLKEEMQNLQIRERELENSLRGANEIEKNARQQLQELLVQETKLIRNFEKTRNNLTQAEQRYSSFETFAKEFEIHSIDFSFFKSHFEFTYDNAISRSLTSYLEHDPKLDLDFLLSKDSNLVENALDVACTNLGKHIREHTNQLLNYFRKADISIIKSEDIAHTEHLANRLNKLISLTKERILELASILDRGCLDNLNKKRSLVRESSLRRIICYSSGVLVKYLSYWLSKELQTKAYQNAPWHNNDLIAYYSDIFIAFALLEERINGNVPVCEGILIVRDYRGENQ